MTAIPDLKHLSIQVIPALEDNYIYLLHNAQKKLTYVIDPSRAAPVLDVLEKQGLKLDGILVTHHHWDHTDGIAELVEKFKCPVYGNTHDRHRIPTLTVFLESEGVLDLDGLQVHHFAIPGHTLGHICYYFRDAGAIFCGDTLFSYGCGRLFEGTPEQMLASLAKIRELPKNSLVCCAHEYTVKNLEFVLVLEPQNQELKKKHDEIVDLRKNGKPSVPSLLSEEVHLNPFLRWDDPILRKAIKMVDNTDLEVFTYLRKRKDGFR